MVRAAVQLVTPAAAPAAAGAEAGAASTGTESGEEQVSVYLLVKRDCSPSADQCVQAQPSVYFARPLRPLALELISN